MSRNDLRLSVEKLAQEARRAGLAEIAQILTILMGCLYFELEEDLLEGLRLWARSISPVVLLDRPGLATAIARLRDHKGPVSGVDSTVR